MKKFLLLLGTCLMFSILQAQPQAFVYSLDGKQILFERNDHVQYVHFVPNADAKGKESTLNNIKEFASHFEMVTPDIYRYDLAGMQVSNFINTIENIDLIASYSSEYRLPGSNTMRWVAKEMYVKVKEGVAIEEALSLARLAYQFAEPVGSFFNTFYIQIENGDIFPAAQRLFETGTVVYAQPSFYYMQYVEESLSGRGGATASSSLPKDWNLRGIENGTMGINAMNAWNITTGNPNITIAIVDDGVLENHPALINNIEGGYNAVNANHDPQGNAWWDDINGTRVAGIVASTNNVQANYGVANNAKVTSIRVRYVNFHLPTSTYVYNSSDHRITKGLQWIKDSTNVDIINFSWVFDEIDPYIPPLTLPAHASMLNDLFTSGRNGKGMVIISGSGNSGRDSVSAPASLDCIIAVGATTTGGLRANYPDWGSNYGIKLDVVAPGEELYTTDQLNRQPLYENKYYNTGGAAAHVSGVAALMLSVNPDLTAAQVKSIIEQTAYKAHSILNYGGVYNYSTHSGRLNGTWNNEMGYGLVDAYAAVAAAICYSGLPVVQGTITQNTTWSTSRHAINDITIPNNVTLTISSPVVCNDNVSINIQPGGKLVIDGGTLTNACTGGIWEGIVVSGGTVEIKNNGKIENAICAVMVKDGGKLEVTNAHFENNTVSNGIIVSNASARWAGNNHLLSVPITLQARATLTNTGTISSNEHTTITVHPSAKIVMDGGTFKNATGQLWQGITALGDPNPRVLAPSQQGYIELRNNSKIENAVCGITVMGGGIVEIVDAHFVNNTIGVKFEPLAPGQSGTSGKFTRTSFVLNNNYIGNTADFEAHLKMENSGIVAVMGCNFSSIAPYSNSLRNYGIMASNTSLTVQEHCPRITTYDGSCDSLVMTRSTFTGFTRAVSANNSGVSPKLTVRYSTFNNNLRSVNVNGINNHQLIRNEFYVTQANSYGVYINDATGYKIEENLFEDTQAATGKITIGLTIRNSGEAENEVYKNRYKNLYVAQQFLCKNSSQIDTIPYGGGGDTIIHRAPQNQITGLQSRCNTFSGSQYRDILVGNLPNQPITCLFSLSIRRDQGSNARIGGSAGNLFQGNPAFNIENDQSQHPINYYYAQTNEFPVLTTNVNKYSTSSNSCPSRVGIIGGGGGDLDRALSQYDEWNDEYEHWLAQFLAFEGNNEEEYNALLDMVSYYSALKDNHFNSILIAINEEIADGMRFETSGDEETGKFLLLKEEKVADGDKSSDDGRGEINEAGGGSLTLRRLLLYRGNYTDYLTVVETYLKENNYKEAMVTLTKMYERFEITEEQAFELNDLGTYIHWLLQLEAEENSIYTLSDNEISYLIHYVETHTGRSRTFAKIILCELYEICIEDEEAEGGKGYAVNGVDEGGKQKVEGIKSPSNIEGVDGAAERGSLYENITVYPNPTTGKLQVTGYELQITSIEIRDVTGRILSSYHLIIPSSNQKVDISHLNSGIYFIKVATNQGEIVKKVVKQ